MVESSAADSYAAGALYYDSLYSFKDYRGEAEHIAGTVGKLLHPGKVTLLDVACGTGKHVSVFSELGFCSNGLDLSHGLLRTARSNFPDIAFHQGDFRNFELNENFDVVTCLFGSIGYAGTIPGLHSAVSCMVRHLKPSGVLVIEPWFTPENWKPGTVHSSIVNEPDLKIVRMNTSKVLGKVSLLDFHYLVGTPDDTIYFTESHELGLFTEQEMTEAFESAGLSAGLRKDSYPGRGLYIGCRKC